LDLRSIGGETALLKSVQSLSAECFSILLQCGADPSLESYDQESVFSLAEAYNNPHIN